MSYQKDEDTTLHPKSEYIFRELMESQLLSPQAGYNLSVKSTGQILFQSSQDLPPCPSKKRHSSLKRGAPSVSETGSPRNASRAGSSCSVGSHRFHRKESCSSVTVSDRSSVKSNGSKTVQFGSGVRNLLTEYYGVRCWLCEQRHRRTDFENYKDRGIVELRELDDLENAIPLCKACHEAMDTSPSQFIMIPSDIQYFINYETADYERRHADARKGIISTRQPPTAESYWRHLQKQGELEGHPIGTGVNRSVRDIGGLYDVYLRVDFLSFDINEEDELQGLYSCSTSQSAMRC
ncbi:hypothetical protein TWF506_004522 [Arthrobotrys conoides]|uniref:Uncharacterized protein n=1 Tax=Arthrobotrys conoides TaxID=74498 RepID=A0AAN8N378_9PEZI